MGSKRSLFRRLLSHTAFFLNLLAAAWLLLCLAAAYVSPLSARYLALFSLTTPFIIIVNLFFVVFWLLGRRKWRLMVSLVLLLCSYRLILSVFGWHYGSNDMAGGANRLKVMTWNVHGFGLFDKPVNPTTDDRIIDFIKKENPDILCLPEYYTIYSNTRKPYSSRILEECGYREFRFKDDNTLGLKIYLGTAIFSKYPIRSFTDVPLAKSVYLLQCDVDLPDGRTVRTFFIHLQSFLLTDMEKRDLEEVKHRERDLPAEKSRSLARRFADAYVKRATQADSAAGIIARSPYPVVICGDFNDLPSSYTYTRMKGNLADAFIAKGRGLGRTYNLFSPTLRIDYIFYDPEFLRIVGYRSPRMNLSDHNPVIANFELRER